MKRCTWFFILSWFVHGASIGLGQGSEHVGLMHEGMDEYRVGHLANAETLFNKALASAEVHGEIDAVAVILNWLGEIYLYEERFRKSEQAYQRALSIFRRNPSRKTEVALTLRNLGSVYSLQRRDREAITVLKEALKLIAYTAAQRELTAGISNAIGVSYFRQQEFGKAESSINQALQLAMATGETDVVSRAFNNLGLIYWKRRKYDKAEAAYKSSLDITERSLGKLHPDVAVTRVNLGIVYTETNRFEDAQDQFLRSLSITEQINPVVEGRVFRILHRLGIAYLGNGKKTEAERVLERAVQIALHNPDIDTEIPAVFEIYSNVLKDAGKLHESRAFHAQAQRIRAESKLTVRAQSLK